MADQLDDELNAPDPKTYAYLVDGVVTQGTLADWAKRYSDTVLGNLQVGMQLWDGHKVHAVSPQPPIKKDDWLHYTVTLRGETVRFRVDARA